MTDTEKVFSLLTKVTDCCDQEGIPYFLGFYAVRLAMTAETLPEGVRSLEIFVRETDLQQLILSLEHREDIAVETPENSPDYTDTCVKAIDRNSVFFDLLHPKSTKAPGYSILITAITNAPASTPRNKKCFIRSHYKRAIINHWSQKPFGGFLKIIRFKNKSYSGELSTDEVCLLRYKYRKMRLPSTLFEKQSQIEWNGCSFSTVFELDEFISFYYKKDLEKYPIISKIDENLFIQEPDVPFVAPFMKKPIMIKIYGKMIGIVNRHIKKSLNFVIKQRRFFYRTADRFAMIDYYTPKKEAYLSAYEKKDWDTLAQLFSEYRNVCEKYFQEKIVFAFDFECYDIMTDLLFNITEPKDLLYDSSQSAKLCKWLVLNREKAFAYLNYVSKAGK